MTEIYWLQRLGILSCVFEIGFIVCLCTICIAAFLIGAAYYSGDIEIEEEDVPSIKRWVKGFSCVLAFFFAGYLFLPSTKELYAIYGIGGTIDYIKSNEKAKQLPDKCVEALTRYVDSIEKEKEKDNNK